MPDLIPVANDPFVDPPSMLVPVDHDPFATPKPGMTVPPADVGQAAARLPGQLAQGAWNASGLGDVYNTIRRGGAWTDVAGAAVPLAMGMMAGPEEKAAQVAEEAATPALKGITAYHGSPYDFDRFDLSKIGTGEGAQAYGHGLYFAENPQVAGDYRDKLSNLTWSLKENAQTPENLETVRKIQSQVSSQATPEDAIRELRDQVRQHFNDAQELQTRRDLSPEWRDQYIAGAQANALDAQNKLDWLLENKQHISSGKMYQVSIAADPEHFLDWDKPLSQQSAHVQQALGVHNNPRDFAAEANAKPGTPEYDALQRSMDARIGSPGVPDVTGADFYRGDVLRRSAADEAGMSNYLRGKGVAGIKYLDQGSRRSSLTRAQIAQQISDRQADLDYLDKMMADPSLSNQEIGVYKGQKIDANERIDQLRNMVPEEELPPQTHNYVVFNDNLINIIKKYGIAGLIAGGASHFSTTPVDHNPFQQ